MSAILVIREVTHRVQDAQNCEILTLTREEARRGYGKFSTREGTEIFLSLPRNHELAAGDVVYCQDGRAIQVVIQYPPAVEMTFFPLESVQDANTRLSAIWSLAHFIGNQHFPLRVVGPGHVRIPINNPDRLLKLLQRFAVPDMTVRVVEGQADDPLPNPQAHGGGA